MKRLIGSILGVVVAGSFLGGCFAVIDPFPGPHVSGPGIVIGPPVIVAPRPRGWYGHQGYGWQRRGYR